MNGSSTVSLLEGLNALPLVQAAVRGDIQAVKTLLPESADNECYAASVAALKSGQHETLRCLLPHIQSEQRHMLLSLATTEGLPECIDTLLDAGAQDPASAVSNSALMAITSRCIAKASPHLEKFLPYYLKLGISSKLWRENGRSAVMSGDVDTVQKVLDAAGCPPLLIDHCVFRAAMGKKMAVLDHLLPICNQMKLGETLLNQRHFAVLDQLSPKLPADVRDHLVVLSERVADPSFLPILHSQHQAQKIASNTPPLSGHRIRSRL